MREILFRGKAVNGGEWLYGDYMYYAGGAQIWTHTDDGTWNAIVDPATVGQYTGLADGTGAKIFEGDIFQDDETGELFLVSICDGMTKFSGEDSTDDWPADIAINGSVIGNIHDNPELLEGGDAK